MRACSSAAGCCSSSAITTKASAPALLDNIFQAFIGPMFLVAESFVVMGQRSDLADAMGEGDVTAR